MVLEKLKSIFKSKGEIYNILLFEQINNTKYFKGIIKGIEKDDIKLGIHIHMPSINHSIRITKNDAFLPSKKGKNLIVCKYAKDDYRIVRFLKEEEFYKKVENIKTKTDEEGNPIIKTNKQGEELTDEEGNPIYEQEIIQELQEYKEPLGASEDAREAMRFTADYKKRLDEVYGQKKTKFDKILQAVTIVIIVLVAFAFVYMTNKNTNETMVQIGESLGKDITGIKEEINRPSFVEKAMQLVENKDKEDNAPEK